MTKKNCQIVVTGATGFLGWHLVQCLQQSDVEVVAVSRSVPVHVGGIQVSDYRDSPQGDVLIHLAEVSDRSKVNLGSADYFNNASSVVHDLASRQGQRLIYASSGAVYGAKNPSPCRTMDKVEGADAYCQLKLLNENTVLAVGGCVVRLSNLIGRMMSPNNVLSDILRQIPGEGQLIVKDDTPVRDFLSVKDAAFALYLLAFREFSGILNVGSGQGVSVRSLALAVLEAAGETSREVIASHPSDGLSVNVLDIQSTLETIPWTPATTLREQLKQILEN